MALNINPLIGMRDAVNVVRQRLADIGNALSDVINNKWVSGHLFDLFFAMFQAQNALFGAMTTVMNKIDETNTFLSDKMATLDAIPAQIEARAVALYVQIRDETQAKINDYAAVVDNWANTEVRPKIASLEQYRTDVEAYFNNDLRPFVRSLRADVNNVGNVINAMTNDRINAARAVADDARARVEGIYAKLPKRTPAEQAAYFKNIARPAYEESWEFFLQNSLWNLRNKTEGSLEWDPIKAEAFNKANAALAAANQNITTLDAKMAQMIADSNGRTTELENKLPLTTAALSKRIDEAKQAATDQANAALAAANENIQTTKAELKAPLDDLQGRVRKMEAEIEKVAPILARLPTVPAV